MLGTTEVEKDAPVRNDSETIPEMCLQKYSGRLLILFVCYALDILLQCVVIRVNWFYAQTLIKFFKSLSSYYPEITEENEYHAAKNRCIQPKKI